MVTENGTQGDGNTSFLRAARAGNLDKVLEHLKNNIDINTSNANGLNALHLASKDGHIHVVSELLRRGAIVDSATKKGNTALHIASLAGQEEVVKMLLQHGASVNVQSQNGFTPLYMAAQENHDSVVKLLLSNGANQSLATEDGFTPLAVAMQQGHDKVVAVLLESDTRGKVRLPALHIAAKKDDVKAATLLLDNDHNPDVTSKSGFTPLHIASHYGNQAIANLLIQKGADVNFSAKHNISPLHVAAKWGKTNMVSLLLEKGANIEAKTRDGLTPLHCAARSGHEQVVDMLLERGAPISAKTKNGLAPLHMAAQGEHVDAARILLYHRAPVDEVTVDYLTALHVAAHCGHVRVAKLLLDRNADANARALNGFTPLHIACKKNRIKVVELLLRHGASISATTESGLTPLHVAAFMGCMNIVIYLLQHDASPDVPTVRGETPLHLAARANQTDIIRILLRNGAQVDARAREQQTPLHIASRLGNVDIVMLLLQHGAQVDATTKDMYTALHIAAKEGQDEVAAVLIENGAALDSSTKKGFTPLHLTAKYGHIKVAQLLLQKEADVDAQGKNGVTPLHVACHYDNQNVALLLLEKGASPHATAKNGHTPLHIAARKNQMDIATTLLEYGAQANTESKAGFTPLHLSCQEGHSEISNLLIEHKAGVNHPAKNGLTPMHLCAQEDNVNVAEILQRNGANIDMATKAGYIPLHVAAHFGQANMVRFLLQHGANVDAATSIGYTPLHQSAQQGHCHIVKLLLEHKANANAQTTSGQTPLDIARKLGYISVLDSLKSITDEPEGSTQLHSDEKYRVVAPEAMHESFMSDSEEEGGEDNMLSDQPYRYLTVDEMKSLGDDSLPIDVTRDERVDSNRMAQSAEYGAGLQQQQPIVEDAISPHKAQTYNAAAGKSIVDGIYMANGLNEDDHRHVGRKLQWKSFLVSFLVDARGGAMRGCRHSGVRMIIPSRSTCQPTRVTCRYVKPQRTMHPPQLMEGEALASRVLELGPVSTKFIGPVIMEVPHFASLRGKEREIIILRSDNGETWREHTIDNSEEIIHDVLQQCFEPEEIAQLEEQAGNHVCRFVTYDFPQYFAVVTRIRQEVHAIGPEGGMVSSTVVPQVQAVFPQGALTKKIKVGLQAQPVDPDLTAKLLGRGVAVSPIVTVEPRRRKFHKAITLSMPAPKAHSQGMINQYSGNTPTLRLLCSITGGPSRAQWEDVTGSTPLTFVNDCVSFTTTVSARFWLMDCRNISEATKMATELYKEVIHVPFIAKFVVFAKKVEPFEARLRVFCMTDDREDKTLEKMELYTQVAKSRDVEVLEGKPQYIEMAGNLVPVTKSGEQLQLPFKAFRENRLPFTVRVKDQHADIVGRTLFMKEPKVAKGEPPQHPICILNIVLPEAVIPDSVTAFSDKITPTYRSSLLSFSKHQNDHYIGDIRIVDLSNLLGKDWIQLASEIDISTEEIDEIINQNTDSIARQAQSMIRLYKDKPNYDIHSLEQALKNIGRDDIMSKCKSGRLSHSRDFDETDIMKNSESVEELVRKESKRIQQIHEREEVKYSAEEKDIEESESDEEIAKRTVAERRDKIVKRLSVERQIPASTQKREITREITEIKRKSLIEDKKAIHESEIFMQLPADNSVKSAVVPEQVIKIKMGKMDSTEISKSDFDKELTHKFKSSSRSSEEEVEHEDTPTIRLHSQIGREEVENLKIVKDITSVEKPSKIIDSLMGEKPSMDSGSKQLTEDFLAFEKLTQLPSQALSTSIDVSEKFIEEIKEKSDESKITDDIKETAEEVVTETVETASKKVESIISSFESSKPEKQPLPKEALKNVQDFLTAERKTFVDSAKTFSKEETSKVEQSIGETKESLSETISVKAKIKAFTEPKLEEVSDKIVSTKESLKKETLTAVEVIESFEESKIDEMKSEKSETKSVSDTIKTFFEAEAKNLKSETIKTKQDIFQTKDIVAKASESTAATIVSFADAKSTEFQSETAALQGILADAKDTNINEIKNIVEATKDFLSSESKIITETVKTQTSKVDSKTEEINEHVKDTKDSLISETESVAETIKAFSEPKKEVMKDTKTFFDKNTEEFKEQVSDTKDTIISETHSVSKTIKYFGEPKAQDINKETKISKDSITEEYKQHVSETKDKIVTERKNIAETIKTFAEPKADEFKKQPSKIETKVVESKTIYDKSTDEFKENVVDMKDSIITETKSTTETIKALTEPKADDINMETTKLGAKVTTTRDSIIEEAKSFFDPKTEDIMQHVSHRSDSFITETKSVAETIKTFSEPKSEDIKKEAKVDFTKESIVEHTECFYDTNDELRESVAETVKALKESSKIKTKVISEKHSFGEGSKSFYDTKSGDIEHLVSDTKDCYVKEKKTNSVTDTIKSFTEPKVADITKESSAIEAKVCEMKETFVEETNIAGYTIKSFASTKTEDLKLGLGGIKEKFSDTKDFIITETKTVAETIKSFSEPKVTSSKIEEKFDDLIGSTKKDTNKVSEAIKSLSESFDKSSSVELKFEKEKIIPSDKIEDKIADFEAKKVTYEYHGLEPKLRLGLHTSTEAEEKETDNTKLISAPEAAPRKLTTAETEEETSFKQSLEKLEEMKSIVADARKITNDFLSMEHQSQLPPQAKIEMKEESKLVEETIKTTITFPPIIETTVTDKLPKKDEQQVESKPGTQTVLSESGVVNETIEQSVQSERVLDSRKLTHDFLSMEQKTHLPYEKQTADDISELSTETSQHSVEKSPIIETDSEKISLEHFEKTDVDARKITHDFLSMEQTQQPFSAPKPRPQDELDQTKLPSIIDQVLIKATDIISTISAGAGIPKETKTSAKDENIKKEDSKSVLKSEHLKDDGIEMAAPVKDVSEMPASLVITLTQDFLTFEQSIPMYTTPKTSADEAKTTTARPEDTFLSTTSELTDITPQNVVKMTGEFLSMEQTAHQTKTDLSVKKTAELMAPIPIEPGKSLTDAEFCKSVQESITKKMSEGLIKISDELQIKESDIPHSQTPPPTPIETKIEKQEEEVVQQKPTMEEDNLFDTVKTLHKTTESTFERVSTISTIETLQTYIPEPEQIVSVEAIATQGTLKYEIENEKYVKDGDDGDKHHDNDGYNDDEDENYEDDDDYEHELDKSVIDTDSTMAKSLPSNVENVRREATVLVDDVLEESIHIVNEQQDRDHIETYNVVVDNNARAEYNSESENYAITCDDVDGLDVIKSPTIESMSGKSFDDNLSFTDEHIATIAGPATTLATYSVQQTQEQVEMLPQDGEEMCATKVTTTQTSVAQETKSTDITPVPPSVITTTSSTLSQDTADAESRARIGDVPQPKPRSVRISTPTEDDDEEKVTEKTSSQLPYEGEEQEVSFDLSDDLDISVVPVPKPRSQMQTSDSFKNLDSLNEQKVHQQQQQQQFQPSQSDSVSLRSFDYTEETSRGDDPSVSVSVSIKSQHLDYPFTATTTATTTTSEDPATESIDPPSELSIDDGNVETERKTSFYIGESSRNIIIKTTPTKLSTSEGAADEPLTMVMSGDPIEATDISLIKEFSVDSDEENDVFKDYVTIKPTEPDAGTRIRRQSSETRNDLLEEDAPTKETIELTTVGTTMMATTPAGATAEEATLRKTSTEQSFTTTTITSTTSTSSAPMEVIHSTGEDDSIREISESIDIEVERPIDLDLPLEKSEWETTEKKIPPMGKGKIVHSPQQSTLGGLTKEALTEEMVAKTLEEVQESLDAAKNELKSVLRDGKSIKESPSEFEFRSFSQSIASGGVDGEKISDTNIKTEKIIEETSELMENEDISSFIGVPESLQDKHSQDIEKLKIMTGAVVDSLNREAAMLHYAQTVFDEKKTETSLGFISTGTAGSQDSHTSSDDNIVKEERASLGFISSETAEDFSSMEDYYQEKLAKADIVTEAKEEKEKVMASTTGGVDTFGEITSELTMKPFEDVVHRFKTDSADSAQNRWSVPEIDQSSSSESYYKSFEKSESRPLSSDIGNLMTQANSSEYQTAADVSSAYRETTEFVSAVSTFDSSLGKTISSHESMRSLDSQSETSANLGSIDVSELSETLVASFTEEAEELQRLQDLADEEDSDDNLDMETTDYTMSESKIQQQSQMKRSQEMIFKPKFDDSARKPEEEIQNQEKNIQSVQIEEYAKAKEVEKTWELTYPMEETKADDIKDTEDILLYHEDVRRSIDDSKYASSLDEGSILSVSMSSTSNIDTVVENFEDIVGSVGASSLAGIDGFGASSLPEETTFVMDMDGRSGDLSPQDSTATTPPGETPSKRGHKRSESTSVSADDLKNIPDKDAPAPQGEGKESESESDTDPYETEYARQFRSPSDRKSKKKKQAAAEMDHSFETEKRPFTPSQLVAEVIVEDSLTEELEAEECFLKERRPSQNMLNYANIPDITVTEDTQPKSPISEQNTFEEKILYKVKTEEELHKATDDRPLHEEKDMVIDMKEENFQKLVQEQYKQKLAELQKAEIYDSDYDYNKAPDSPDSFEMVDQPDISDEFVIIEEVAKEANEDDLGGKSIRIAPTKYESKHDEEVEKIIIKSAPADPKLGSQIFRDDLNFEFEESPPTGSSGGAGSEAQDESDPGADMAANNKRWVEMQLTDNQLRYPYDLTGGVLEDIKEEDAEFEVGSSRISSFKDSFSSTPEYDVMAARRYYATRGEHDDISMSSLQEFESLEQAISLENRNRTHQGSTDSSNGSFQRRYILRNSSSGPAQGDDISVSSLKEFEGIENACIEAHLIEIKAKEEAAMLSRSDESNKSNGSDREQIFDPTKVVLTKVTRTVTHTEVLQSGQQPPDIETLLKQKLQECERAQSSVQITEIPKTRTDSDRGSVDSLEMNRSLDIVTSSVDDSFDISKDGTTKSDIDSLEVDKRQPTREESIESIEMEHMDDVMSKFGVTLGDGLTTTTTTTTTSTDADGCEHTTVTKRIITKSTLSGGGASSTSLDGSIPEMMTKDYSAESLNQISVLDQTTTSSAGTTATYQTSAGNSQMSGSITSCASSTLMEDSAMSMSALTMSSSYWSHEEETVKEGTDVITKDTVNKEDHPPH